MRSRTAQVPQAIAMAGPYGNRRNTRAEMGLVLSCLARPGHLRGRRPWTSELLLVGGGGGQEAKWTHSGTHPAASRAGSSPGQDKLRVVCPIGCCLRTSRSADSDAKGKKKMWRVDEMVWCRGGACVEHLLPVTPRDHGGRAGGEG